MDAVQNLKLSKFWLRISLDVDMKSLPRNYEPMSWNFTSIFIWKSSPHLVEQNKINLIQNGHLVAELRSF